MKVELSYHSALFVYHIIITTPESFSLAITATKFKEKFTGVEYVILDAYSCVYTIFVGHGKPVGPGQCIVYPPSQGYMEYNAVQVVVYVPFNIKGVFSR